MITSRFWTRYFQVYDYLNTLIPYQELLMSILSEIKGNPGEMVLDAGSGTGNLSLLLEKSGLKVIAFDFSKEGIKIHQLKQPSVKIIYGSLTDPLPFPDSSFDKICTNNTIYTIEKNKRLKIFNEFYRILKPNGIVVTSNLHVNFSPFKIYKEHLRRKRAELGWGGVFKHAISLFIPTVRIFFFNFILQLHNKGIKEFMHPDEQRKLLIESGFRNVSSDRYVYAGQAIMNSAQK